MTEDDRLIPILEKFYNHNQSTHSSIKTTTHNESFPLSGMPTTQDSMPKLPVHRPDLLIQEVEEESDLPSAADDLDEHRR